jgi:AsmA protein
MRILKALLYTLAGLLGLALVALAAVAMIVDGGFVKSRLEQAMKDKQRTLAIEGEPKLSLFPVAALTLGRTTLTEPSSKDLFLELQSAEVAVRVLPLLSGALVVDKVSAHGVRVNVRRLKDGRMNFDDLREERGREPPRAEKDAKEEKGPSREREEGRRDLPKLVVGEIDIDKVRVSFADEASGQEVAVEDFTLKLARLSGDAPSPLTLNATVTGKRPEVNLKAQASGQVKLDLARQSLAFSSLDARVSGHADKAKALDLRLSGDLMADGRRGLLEVNGVELKAAGTLDRDAMTASVSAPRISVTPDKATGSAVTGALRIAGPERKLEAKLDMGAVEGSATSLSIPQLALRFDAAADGGVLRGAINTPVRANLKQKTWELPKLAADLALTHPKLPQSAGKSAARLPIEATVKADHEKQTLSVNAAANAEDLDFRLELRAKHFMPLDASFELNSKRMNLDRYPFLLGGAGGAKKQEDRIDLSGLAGRTVNGKVRIGSLQAQNVKLSDFSADVKLARGTLEVSPLSARLYEGKLDGAVSANARGNQVAIRQSLQGVQINPLLKDLAQKDILEGKGDVSIDVTGAGATVPVLKRSLAGNARLQLKDGAYKGINLAEVFSRARAALGSRSEQAAVKSGGAQKTDFSELSASFVIRGGVARNEDLALRSPFVRAGGSGSFDIAASALDYTVKPTVVATATGQQGRDDAAGLTVPVRIHGPLDALRYDVDYRGLASDSLRERLNQRLNERLGGKAEGKTEDGKPAPSPQDQLRDQVRDRLKGILGR